MTFPDNSFPIRLNNPRAWRTYIGGSSLDALHGICPGEDGHFPEEWIMSTVSARNAGREDIKDEGMSYLHAFPSLSLKELIASDPSYYLGDRHSEKYGSSLGVLLKLIDSAERLTLQVHPDRQDAMKLFNSPYGKTECWHILGGHEMNGEPPCIYLGFKENITREYWKSLFDKQDLQGMLDVMQKFPVKPGDTVLIEGGMPHAIGAGCFLVEIQEPTDFTIRVERTTPSGFHVADFMCHQGLGFERMFDAFHYTGMPSEVIRDHWFISKQEKYSQDGGSVFSLIGYDTTKFFSLDEIIVEKTLSVPCEDSFSGLYVLDGCGKVCAGGKKEAVEKTAQFFVPCGVKRLYFEAEDNHPLRILHFRGPSLD